MFRSVFIGKKEWLRGRATNSIWSSAGPQRRRRLMFAIASFLNGYGSQRSPSAIPFNCCLSFRVGLRRRSAGKHCAVDRDLLDQAVRPAPRRATSAGDFLRQSTMQLVENIQQERSRVDRACLVPVLTSPSCFPIQAMEEPLEAPGLRLERIRPLTDSGRKDLLQWHTGEQLPGARPPTLCRRA